MARTPEATFNPSNTFRVVRFVQAGGMQMPVQEKLQQLWCHTIDHDASEWRDVLIITTNDRQAFERNVDRL